MGNWPHMLSSAALVYNFVVNRGVLFEVIKALLLRIETVALSIDVPVLSNLSNTKWFSIEHDEVWVMMALSGVLGYYFTGLSCRCVSHFQLSICRDMALSLYRIVVISVSVE